MACSAIYFLDNKGKVLISRNYRGDIENSAIDKFIGDDKNIFCGLLTELSTGLVSDREEENDPCPLIKTEECTFAYIKQSNVYMVATMRANSNVAMLFSLMHRICQVNTRLTPYSPDISSQVMGEYFKEVEEESIRDNFVICYELLDELVDFGYPQTTDAKILQEYITQV